MLLPGAKAGCTWMRSDHENMITLWKVHRSVGIRTTKSATTQAQGPMRDVEHLFSVYNGNKRVRYPHHFPPEYTSHSVGPHVNFLVGAGAKTSNPMTKRCFMGLNSPSVLVPLAAAALLQLRLPGILSPGKCPRVPVYGSSTNSQQLVASDPQ